MLGAGKGRAPISAAEKKEMFEFEMETMKLLVETFEIWTQLSADARDDWLQLGMMLTHTYSLDVD